MLSGSLRGRGGGGEEWEGLLCWETERERERKLREKLVNCMLKHSL